MNYLYEGFKIIFKPGLKRFVIIPLIINIIFFVFAFITAKHYFGQFNLWVTHYLPHWLTWLSGILWVTFFIGFLLVMTYTFVTVANLISSPFNGLLAEKVEYYLTGKNIDDRPWAELMRDTPRMVGRQFKLITYYLPKAILLLALFFVPLIHFFAGVLWFIFNAWCMALQYIDYPTDNHKIPLEKVYEWLRIRRWESLRFGASVLLMSMIPVLNFFVVPAAVAGATKFYLEN